MADSTRARAERLFEDGNCIVPRSRSGKMTGKGIDIIRAKVRYEVEIAKMMGELFPLALKGANQFASPEDNAGSANNERPIRQGERAYLEHLAAQADYQHLAQNYEQAHKEETAVGQEPVEGTATCEEGFGVEHIPELKHDEEGEEYCALIGRYFVRLGSPCKLQKRFVARCAEGGVLEYNHETQQQDCEESTQT